MRDSRGQQLSKRSQAPPGPPDYGPSLGRTQPQGPTWAPHSPHCPDLQVCLPGGHTTLLGDTTSPGQGRPLDGTRKIYTTREPITPEPKLRRKKAGSATNGDPDNWEARRGLYK